MRLRALFLFALITLPLASVSADDDPFKDTKIEPTALGEGVWMLAGRGGNMLLVTGEGGALLVDDQFAPLTERIVAAAGALTDQPLKWVVNTHWHGDHTGGNENLGTSGAIIVAHEGVHRRMSSDQVMELWNKTVPAAPMVARPVVTFTEGVTLHLAGRPAGDGDVGGRACAHRRRLLRPPRGRQRAAHERRLLQRLLPVHRHRLGGLAQRRDRGGREGAGHGR
ncbi:MAG: MBL fold metallo-hydrolase [Proteobacteria bacterium]|nr:MBL fold metallo-hydrolase [Pseudomonadota bacterium]